MKSIFAASLVAIPALVLSLALPTAGAQVLFDNGPSTGWTGNAHELTGSIQAEDFTLADPVTITAIRFYAIERGSAYAGSILWSIRPDQAGTPAPSAIAGDLSQPTRTLTGVHNNDYHGAAESLVSVEIPPVVLGPGRYWLTLHNGPLSNDQPSTGATIFMWQTTAAPLSPGLAGVEDVAPFEGTWQSAFTGERSFQLIGVPEPASLASLLLICVAATRRRRGGGG